MYVFCFSDLFWCRIKFETFFRNCEIISEVKLTIKQVPRIILNVNLGLSKCLSLLSVIFFFTTGCHRALGVSISKTKSLLMDVKVWTPPLIKVSGQKFCKVIFREKVLNRTLDFYATLQDVFCCSKWKQNTPILLTVELFVTCFVSSS